MLIIKVLSNQCGFNYNKILNSPIHISTVELLVKYFCLFAIGLGGCELVTLQVWEAVNW